MLTFFCLILPFVIYSKIQNIDNLIVNKNLILLLIVSLLPIIYWIYNQSWQFNYLVESIKMFLQESSSGTFSNLSSPIQRELSYTLLRDSSILLIIFFSIIGCFLLISKYSSNINQKCLGIGSILFTGSILLFINLGITFIIINRWFPFLYIIITIPSAMGVIFSKEIFNRNFYKIVFICTLIGLMSIINITTYNEDMEDSIYTKNNQDLWRYNEQDIQIAKRLFEFSTDQTLITDFFYIPILKHEFGFTKTIILPNEKIDQFFANLDADFSSNTDKISIIRAKYLNNYLSRQIIFSGIKQTDKTIKFDGTKIDNYYSRNNDKVLSSEDINIYK
jgi:hypothetical protein